MLRLRNAPAMIDDHYSIAAAINEIRSIYGHEVSVDAKAKSLIKFGARTSTHLEPLKPC